VIRIIKTCEGNSSEWWKDMLERPVRILASGETAYVVGGVVIAGHNTYIVTSTPPVLDKWGDVISTGEPIAEPIMVSSRDCQPLCLDCCEPLYDSVDTGPGKCLNPQCFLYDNSAVPEGEEIER